MILQTGVGRNDLFRLSLTNKRRLVSSPTQPSLCLPWCTESGSLRLLPLCTFSLQRLCVPQSPGACSAEISHDIHAARRACVSSKRRGPDAIFRFFFVRHAGGLRAVDCVAGLCVVGLAWRADQCMGCKTIVRRARHAAAAP